MDPRGPITLNVAAFRQEFSNFQLNTFNGTVFLVQNINGCGTDLGTAPTRDLSAGDRRLRGRTTSSHGVIATASSSRRRSGRAATCRVTAGLTYANTHYRDDLVGSDTGAPLDPALFLLPGDNLSNAPEHRRHRRRSPGRRGSAIAGFSGLFYVDARLTDDYNTGSDLFPRKGAGQLSPSSTPASAFAGREQRWSVELWAQNLFDTNYSQVAFNSPFQGSNAVAPCRRSSARRASPRPTRSSRPSSPSRAPTASPAASASDRDPDHGAGPSPATAGAFSFRPPGGRCRQPAPTALSSRACSAFSRAGALDLRAGQVGQIEDVDRALAIGGDMGAVDHGARHVDARGPARTAKRRGRGR